MCTLMLLTGCGEEVTVAVDGAGRVTSNPPGIDCGVACRTKVSSGTQLELTVQPAPGSIFSGWGGPCSGQKETCTIVVDAPAMVTVKLSKLHRVEIEKKGDGKGTIVSNPPGIECGEKCSGEFPDGTDLKLEVQPELGVRIVEVGPCGAQPSCTVKVAGPLRLGVELDVVPGTLLSSERIDEEGRGAFILDSSGNAVWGQEQRLETFGTDGKRLRRSSLAGAKITAARALAAGPNDTIIVAGDGEGSSIVASIRSTGDPAWTFEVPGRVLGAATWSKGSVVATAIDGKVRIGERSYGAKGKKDVLVVWLDDAGKVSDSTALELAVSADTAAFAVDGSGAALTLVKAGKKHVLAKAAGTEGQAWNVRIGELERAHVAVNSAGEIWVAGTALSLDEALREAGAKVDKQRPCRDAGFGFFAKLDPGGQVQSARVLERGIAGFGLDPAGKLIAAVEFVGDVATATGSFTSAGFAAKIGDCDQICQKDCRAEADPAPCDRCKASCAAEREASMSEAVCATEPDLLIGMLEPSFEFAWARQLSVEGELSIEGLAVRNDGIIFVAPMSAGRMRVIGGPSEVTVPSGVSLLVFR